MRIWNFLFISSIILFSCKKENHNDALQYALQYAGNNRPELEKVLAHYSQRPEDSLKLRAAEFLIANMPGKYSYNTEALAVYYAKAEPVMADTLPLEKKIDTLNIIAGKFPMANMPVVEDIRIMKAEYLIKNIEQAFDGWQNGQWAQHLGFDDFCEFLLPYKEGNYQPLDDWRDSLCIQFSEGMQNLPCNQLYQNSTYHACRLVQSNIRNQMHPALSTAYRGPSFVSASNMTKISFGACEDYVNVATCVMRSKGIPVVKDFTPQWPFRSQGHSWNVLLANKEMVFGGIDESGPGEPHKPDHKMGKVYRKTYAINKELLELNTLEKNVPHTFRNFCMIDVTGKYMPVHEVSINIPSGTEINGKYAYLSVFDNRNWIPLAWGKIDRHQAIFKDVGGNITYLPVYCNGEKESAFNYPFRLDIKGNIHHFLPDTSQMQDLVLYRKFPVLTHVYDMTMRMVGGKIQVSNTADFRNPVTLHEFKEWTASGTVIPGNTGPYRYWRYLSPDLSYGNIAELMFYSQGSSTPTKGKVIGTAGHQGNSSRSRDAVFDGDPLTFFDAPIHSGAWVGMDFGKPVDIERIIYLPRSDDNNIRIGDEYELLYWGRNGWISLGKQTAADIKLSYPNVPSRALFLLRDHTQGQEERIFSYENGKQIWW